MEINLTKITINSFKGIDASKPVMLDLGKSYQKGKNITVFKSDQGTGKSSTMEAIMYLLAHNFGKNPAWDKDNLKNITDDTLNAQGELTIDGEKYRVRCTKDKFVFEKFMENIEKWQPLDEPKSTLQKLIGPLGISPMFLKEKKGDDQIKWFRDTFSGDPEAEKKEASLKAKKKTLDTTRRDTNRDYVNIKKALEGNDLFQDWEANAERFKEEVKVDEVKAAFDAARAGMENYQKAVNAVPQFQAEVRTIDENIAELEEKLLAAKGRKIEKEKRIEDANVYIAANATVKFTFDDAEKAYMEVSQTMAQQTAWKKVQADKLIMDEFETAVQKLDAQRDKVEVDLQKLAKKYLPEIDGLTINLKDGEEGIYYNDKSPAQLSESEIWDIYLEICELKGIQFVFIENVSGLGSIAADTINKLSKAGVKIFATMMDRKVKSLKFSMTEQLS